ncbi:aldehyde dehydrogenase family protein [Woeseia oceani]|uniref:Aldehyde dehydrogenase PuuC n=1 Tax=Woeseia oceani TaxID=1548547 RepID=A0A193LES7_9GAMM|nr:aldehyde dehydrogenase family protein [Woeseia oceani]ANO51012.1 aldehyde dehydrogenase PuuC [Woeseia oceani]
MCALSKDDWLRRASKLRPDGNHFIAGRSMASLDGRSFDIVNPATAAVHSTAARGSAQDIDAAVLAARRAFPAWSGMAPRERLRVLMDFADRIEADGENLALMDTLDMGMPISNMIDGEVPEAAGIFRFFAETIDKLNGQVTRTDVSAFNYILHEPLGVVGAITPWNFPLTQAAGKIAPALAAGNTLVLKPSEESPLSATRMAQLFIEAGGPPGVFNVVNGLGAEAGKALALHMDVAKIAFTGSVAVGRKMMVYSGESNLKHVATELGGKSPQIILADVGDVDFAVDCAIHGIFGNTGQVCNAASRMLVHASVHDEFVEKLTALTPSYYLPGDPLDPGTTLGPLVSQRQQETVLGYLETGRQEGATLVFGGNRPAAFDTGYYVEPSLFTGVDNGMRIAQEEIFGPVASVIRVQSDEEAIQIANDSIYGLTASVFTRDLAKAHRLARDIQAGVVWINTINESDMTMPWGGVKQSGNGRDNCLATMYSYLQTKSVWTKLA